MLTFERRFEWSRKFNRAIEAIIRAHIPITQAPLIQDQNEATDFIVSSIGGLKIGSRVRSFTTNQTWRRQFTIRRGRFNGIDSELEKVRANYIDWFLYGFQKAFDERAGHDEIGQYVIINVRAFNIHCCRLNEAGDPVVKPERRENFDGSEFWAYSLDSFKGDPPLIIAENPWVPKSPCPTGQTSLGLAG